MLWHEKPEYAETLRRLRGGDMQTYETLYKRYYDQLLAYTRSLLGKHSSEAEDIVSEVFTHGLERVGTASFESYASLYSFFGGIANNRVQTFWRRYRPSCDLESLAAVEATAYGEASPEEALDLGVYEGYEHSLRSVLVAFAA